MNYEYGDVVMTWKIDMMMIVTNIKKFENLRKPEAHKALHNLIVQHAMAHKEEVVSHQIINIVIVIIKKIIITQVDVIVGLDARGFLLGPAMALAINKPFVPIRSTPSSYFPFPDHHHHHLTG